MKKTLVVLAAFACAGTAFAQSSATLFGVVDVAYENLKTNAGRIGGIVASGNSSSRLGFRGTEDLGGGMAASFWLEAAMNPNSGAFPAGTTTNNQSANIPAGSLIFNRRSTVSLAGGFGEVRIGRDYTPAYWNSAIFDAFGNVGVGATLGGYAGAGLANTFVRASNSIAYFLPGGLGGLYGQAMYAFGNRASTETATGYGITRDTSGNGRYVGLRVGYSQGPFNTALGYARMNYAPGTNTASVLGLAAVPSGAVTDLNWGGSYMFGSVKGIAQYFRTKAADAGTPGNSLAAKSWALGMDWGIGAGDVIASYSRTNLSGYAAAPNASASKWALGYVHNLSKRTAMYGTYARVSNSGGAAMTANSYTASGNIVSVTGAANVNGSATGFDVGLRHSF